MPERLSTGPSTTSPESGLFGPVFSGPDDCADLVNFSQIIDYDGKSVMQAKHFDVGGIGRKGTEIEGSLVRHSTNL